MKDFEWLLNVRGGARLRDWGISHTPITRDRPPAYWFRRVCNFGDQLSPVILGWVLGAEPLWVTTRYKAKVLAVGSILDATAERDIIWGTGAIDERPYVPPPGVSFLAVRGPLTRDLISADVPAIYGDPALLLPQFYNSFVERQFSLGIVPHYVDRQAVELAPDYAVRVIDVQQPWKAVVDAIRACDIILSSSLHGIIVAEAYGIPCSWIHISNRIVGGKFKFNDHYLATGRDARVPVSLSKGLNNAIKEIAPPPKYDPCPLMRAATKIPDALR